MDLFFFRTRTSAHVSQFLRLPVNPPCPLKRVRNWPSGSREATPCSG